MDDRQAADRTNGLERFFFGTVRPEGAAVFRIALAIALPVFFHSAGLGLSPPLDRIPGATELYDDVFLTTSYWLLISAVAALLGVGWHSRAVCILLLALLLPLAFLDGARQSRQILLFTLLAFSFVRSDAAYSLAGVLRRDPSPTAGPMWPIRLIQLQLSILYGVNAVAKTTPEYLSGEILIGMSRTLPNFLVDLSDGTLRLGPLVMPVVLAAIVSVATEYFLAIGFWFRRLRVVAAAVGVVFHGILKTVVTIHMLDWASMFLYLAFLLPFEDPACPAPARLRPGTTEPDDLESGSRLPLFDRATRMG